MVFFRLPDAVAVAVTTLVQKLKTRCGPDKAIAGRLRSADWAADAQGTRPDAHGA